MAHQIRSRSNPQSRRLTTRSIYTIQSRQSGLYFFLAARWARTAALVATAARMICLLDVGVDAWMS